MVVLFHAGLPVPGGFVGVDVFFVISGFVITSMLLRERHATGRIAFGRFYVRRFKRLTPALSLMVTCTLVAAALFLSPVGAQETAAQTGLGAMLLMANLVVDRTTGGYFDAPAEANPLLHTWTLSVEEQFYLAFPLLLTIAWLIARRTLRLRTVPVLAVSGVAVASFALAVAGTAGWTFNGPSWVVGPWLVGFYSPLTRAWEFAAGALLALLAVRVASAKSSRLLGYAGLALLLVSVWVIDGQTPFPGLWTLLPVVGTLLLLAAGTVHQEGASRVLATQPMVRVGDWSYSIYLWHWPLIAFAGLLWPGRPGLAVVAAALSLAPALASFRWVEQPLRQIPTSAHRRIARVALVAMTVPIVLALALIYHGHLKSQDPAYADTSDFFAQVRADWYPCPAEVEAMVTARRDGFVRCFQSKPGTDYDTVIFGDSHGEHLFPGLAAALPHDNVLILHAVEPFVSDAQGKTMVDFINDQPGVDTVVYSAKWDKWPLDAVDSAGRGLGDQVAATLSALQRPGREVLLVEDVPRFGFQGYDCAFAPLIGSARCEDAEPPDSAAYRQLLGDVAASTPGTQFVPIKQLFCADGVCHLDHDGTVIFRDYHHLTVAGSEYVARTIVRNLHRATH